MGHSAAVIRKAAPHALDGMKALLPTTLVTAMALVAGCGGSSDDGAKTSGASSTAKSTSSITIADFKYDPDPSSVKAGTKVTVKNTDSSPHTLTDKGSGRAFDSGTVKGGKTGSVTFTKPGTYQYTCEFHPTMAGTVTVTK
jgi:plastocyanin